MGPRTEVLIASACGDQEVEPTSEGNRSGAAAGRLMTAEPIDFRSTRRSPAGAWLVEDALGTIPETAMSPIAAMRLVTNEPRG